jgi:recombination protein RecA
MYNEGISKVGDMIDVAVEHGIVNRSGSWFAYGEDRVQGRDGLRKMLQDNPEVLTRLEKEVRVKLGMGAAETK